MHALIQTDRQLLMVIDLVQARTATIINLIIGFCKLSKK